MGLSIAAFTGCGASSDATTLRRAAIDSANLSLSQLKCGDAIRAIDPIYNSESTDNEVRLVRASAYACSSGMNFFQLLDDLSKNTSKLASAEIWQLFTQLFPSDLSDAQDRVVEGAQGATDALLASIRNDAVITNSTIFDAESFNPKSMSYDDRTADSNIYLTFVSMAAIGGYNNRYGDPDPTTFKKGNPLPWVTASATDMATDGCGYASSVVNFADALGGLADAAQGELATKLITMRDTFQALIYSACQAGCTNTIGKDLNGADVAGWLPSGCTVTNGSCARCPLTLRDRSTCTGRTSNIESCAAAGIINFMNTHPLGWQGP